MNWRKLRIKDVLSLTKWKVFIVGTYLMRIRPFLKRLDLKLIQWGGNTTVDNKDIQKELTGEENPNKVDEVNKAFNIVYRYLRCKDCMKAGHCKHCGCTTPDNIIPEKNFCSKFMWGTMEPDIFAFLDEMGLEITLTQKNKR